MEPFKNAYSYRNACIIAERIKAVHPEFSMPAFRKGLEKSLEPLELKQRMQLIAARITECLSLPPAELFPILVRTLASDEDDAQGLRGFAVWPLTEIVAREGLVDFKSSMKALEEMTSRFTGEFAIRPFLRMHREKTLAQCKKWTRHPDAHVRRLVSEGTRPLLPWGERLPDLMADPSIALPLLEALHRDPSDYVTLSVSNHLNDFSKAHPEWVMDTLSSWRSNASDDARFAKLARHASRTLVKQGHPLALGYHGFGAAADLKLVDCSVSPSVLLGGAVNYRLTLKNTSRSAIRVLFDYAIFHKKANGSLTPKVFKGRTKELQAGETWEISGKHPIRPITTRVYYPGTHRFEPRINGSALPAVDFILEI